MTINSPQEIEERMNSVLEFIGFHKNEKIIYLDLLKHGLSTASEISKRTHLHRTNTYDSLRKLSNLGFTLQTKTNIKTTFRAMEIEKIRDYINQKKDELEEIIPIMKDISRTTSSKEDISISKGTFAAREALIDLLDERKEIKAYGASGAAVNVLGFGFLKDFHAQRIKKNILMRHIYNVEAMGRIKYLNKIKYTKARHLSKDYDSSATNLVCGDTLLIFIFSLPVSVITIRRQEIADAYAKYFEILWAKAKE